jgi:hypothetical protein
MDTPLKPLLSPDVDTDLEDDDVAPSLSNAPPCYDALPASQPGVAQEDELEDVAFVNWWRAVRSGPEQRNSVFKLTYVWSGDRRCNAIHVRRLVVVRAVGIGLISTFVRAPCVERHTQVQGSQCLTAALFRMHHLVVGGTRAPRVSRRLLHHITKPALELGTLAEP